MSTREDAVIRKAYDAVLLFAWRFVAWDWKPGHPATRINRADDEREGERP